MRDTELYQHLLGLVAPRSVDRSALDVPGGRVDVWVKHDKKARFRFPHRGPECALYDHAKECVCGVLRGHGLARRGKADVRRSPSRRRRVPLRAAKREPFREWLHLFSGGLRLNTQVPHFLARRFVTLDDRVRIGNRPLGPFALIVVDRRA